MDGAGLGVCEPLALGAVVDGDVGVVVDGVDDRRDRVVVDGVEGARVVGVDEGLTTTPSSVTTSVNCPLSFSGGAAIASPPTMATVATAADPATMRRARAAGWCFGGRVPRGGDDGVADSGTAETSGGIEDGPPADAGGSTGGPGGIGDAGFQSVIGDHGGRQS